VLAPRPCPFPASAVPDNCLIHAALGNRILHLDDDLDVHRELIAYVRTLPEPAVTWGLLRFVGPDWLLLPDARALDSRPPQLARFQHSRVPAGLLWIPPGRMLHWGAAWSILRLPLLSLGGHDLKSAGFHNSDTRLGHRLAHAFGSYLSVDERFTVSHLGLSWCMATPDLRAVRAARAVPLSSRPKANGGLAFWSSPWFSSAYSVAARFSRA